MRLALGAPIGRVMRQVLTRTLRLAGFGGVAGTPGALMATRTLSKLLYETSPTDPATFAVVTALLVAVALVASLVPALRASRVDPVLALRAQ